MNQAPKPPEPPREDVEQGGGEPVESGDVERAAEPGNDQAGAVSPELGPATH